MTGNSRERNHLKIHSAHYVEFGLCLWESSGRPQREYRRRYFQERDLEQSRSLIFSEVCIQRGAAIDCAPKRFGAQVARRFLQEGRTSPSLILSCELFIFIFVLRPFPEIKYILMFFLYRALKCVRFYLVCTHFYITFFLYLSPRMLPDSALHQYRNKKI